MSSCDRDGKNSIYFITVSDVSIVLALSKRMCACYFRHFLRVKRASCYAREIPYASRYDL